MPAGRMRICGRASLNRQRFIVPGVRGALRRHNHTHNDLDLSPRVRGNLV